MVVIVVIIVPPFLHSLLTKGKCFRDGCLRKRFSSVGVLSRVLGCDASCASEGGGKDWFKFCLGHRLLGGSWLVIK